jgi:sugar transferase (PEP-CTERM system associated)
LKVFRHHVHNHFLVLVLLDLVAFVLAPIAAALLRYVGSSDSVRLYVPPLGPIAVIFGSLMWLGMLAMGLYSPRQRARIGGITLRVIVSATGAFVVYATLMYIMPGLFVGRGVLGLAALIAAVAAAVLHVAFERFFADDTLKRRVLVLGDGRRASSIRRLRRRSDQRGFVIVGFVHCEGDAAPDADAETAVFAAGRRVVPGEDIAAFCRSCGVDEIVTAMDDRRRGFPLNALVRCKIDGIDVVDLVDFLERETGKLRLDLLHPGWIIFSRGFRAGPVADAVVRLLDIAASLLLLAISLPFMLAAIIAIKIEDGWRAPVVYRQERVGLGGRVFEVLKFRSMRVDAEAGGRAQWAAKGDARVTRVGAVIRKLRLDELPQIFNVLRGDMSLVGPRPERPQFVEELAREVPYYVERHTVKPGVTGWAQLCYPYGSSVQDAVEKLQYDLFYVKNRSLLFNVMVLLQTVEVVAFGKGAR